MSTILKTLKLDRITVAELAELYEAKGSGLADSVLEQTRVALGELKTAPLVFQPRDMTDRKWVKAEHIATLSKAVREDEKLDHIDVFAIDGVRFVVDGHCRLEAYRRAGFSDKQRIPVRHLQGTFADALRTSAAANSKDKLAFTKADKWEAAWRMVLLDEQKNCYSLRVIADAAKVGKSTVANMKATLADTLDFNPRELSWREVKQKLRGEVEHNEDWKEKQTREFAEKLWKHFGTKPNFQPDLFLDAIEYAYPQVYSEVLQTAVRERRDELMEFEEDLSDTTAEDDF